MVFIAGQRFGSLQIKLGVVHLIKNYRITLNNKTRVPFQFSPVSLLLDPIGGIWLDFKKICV